MFSVDDALIRHEWTASLKREIEACSNAVAANDANLSSPRSSRFHRAAANVAFKILQETLIGSEQITPVASKFDKSSAFHHDRGDSGSSAGRNRAVHPRSVSKPILIHARSKSRSQMHRESPGNATSEVNGQRGVSRDDDENGLSDSYGGKDQSHAEGKLWTGRDLEMHCQQNSSIALVLSYLQVGAPDHADESS